MEYIYFWFVCEIPFTFNGYYGVYTVSRHQFLHKSRCHSHSAYGAHQLTKQSSHLELGRYHGVCFVTQTAAVGFQLGQVLVKFETSGCMQRLYPVYVGGNRLIGVHIGWSGQQIIEFLMHVESVGYEFPSLHGRLCAAYLDLSECVLSCFTCYLPIRLIYHW